MLGGAELCDVHDCKWRAIHWWEGGRDAAVVEEVQRFTNDGNDSAYTFCCHTKKHTYSNRVQGKQM